MLRRAIPVSELARKAGHTALEHNRQRTALHKLAVKITGKLLREGSFLVEINQPGVAGLSFSENIINKLARGGVTKMFFSLSLNLEKDKDAKRSKKIVETAVQSALTDLLHHGLPKEEKMRLQFIKDNFRAKYSILLPAKERPVELFNRMVEIKIGLENL